jgi:hypothetical protein
LVPYPGKPLVSNVRHPEKQVKQSNLPKREDRDHPIGSNIDELSQ